MTAKVPARYPPCLYGVQTVPWDLLPPQVPYSTVSARIIQAGAQGKWRKYRLTGTALEVGRETYAAALSRRYVEGVGLGITN